ncbi:MAG: zinc-dependent peptidase [Pontiellaceae bacterium]|nr:zinc-dependent peptidase [Pontiellaceae bacterium]MBN2785407.1 zinc-dependent peptidase [Pontiellaceae bacterium]
MTLFHLFYSCIAAAALAGAFILIIHMNRRRIRQQPPGGNWTAILKRNLPMFEHLTGEQRTRLYGMMHLFLARKKFEGCGGQEITEEIKVTIAAQACLLLIGHKTKAYPRLKTILVYPHAYQSGQKGLFGGDNGQSARLGESWNSGVVVLAWDSVLGGARNILDGHNVTLHEFAHQLDQEDGAADGAPILAQRTAYVDWARVFRQEYTELVDKTRRGRKSTLDRYGATNPAEFFAVATETFFEKPHQLKSRHPELYAELQDYYRLDPGNWQEP